MIVPPGTFQDSHYRVALHIFMYVSPVERTTQICLFFVIEITLVKSGKESTFIKK